MGCVIVSLGLLGFPDGSSNNESACSARDRGSIPGSGRSPGGGHGNPLQYSGLENPVDRGAWWATIHGVAQSDMTERAGLSFSSLSLLGFMVNSHYWNCIISIECGPWGREESDTTEQLPFHFSLSCTGEGNGNPLQCSCLESPRDRGAWWAAI